MFTNDIISIASLAFLGSMAGLIGGVVFLLKKRWARKFSALAIPFTAGVLITVSLLHLLPESVELLGKDAYLYLVLAFFSSFLFEEYFAHLHHHETKRHTMLKASVPLVLLGDTIHNFIDGVTIASAYLVDPTLGLVITFSTFLHETPHEIGDFGVLMSAGWSRSKTFIANAVSASATFPGAFLVYFFMRDAHESIGGLLAISAGIFLYLGASDFLPDITDEDKSSTRSRIKRIGLLFLGVLIMYGSRVS